MPASRNIRSSLPWLCPLALGITLPLAAQQRSNADGRALDANPQVGSGGTNQVENEIDYQVRNNLVTGNVAGGFRFRDSVGYDAPGAFRDSLGSDDLFNFRADSLGSSPAAVNVPRGNIDGQNVTVYRNFTQPTAPRQGNALVAPEGGVFRPYRGTDSANPDRITLDRSLPEVTDTANSLGVVVQPDGSAQRVVADPLRGVRRSPLRPADALPDPLDRARTPLDTDRGDAVNTPRTRSDSQTRGYLSPQHYRADRSRMVTPDTGFELDSRKQAAPTLVLGQLATNRGNPQTIEDRVAKLQGQIFGDAARASRKADGENDAYQNLLDRIQERAREKVAAENRRRAESLSGLDRPDWMKSVEEPTEQDVQNAETRLNEMLAGIREARAQREQAAREREGGSAGGDDPLNALNPSRPSPAPESEDREASESLNRLLEDLRHNVRIDSMVGDRDDRVAELFGQAQAQMQAGDFLKAERTYRMVRVEDPDNPLAVAGLVHAQMGAGMIRSAALNLRRLFESHPQLIATRYGRELLPPAERLGWVQQELQRIIDDKDSSTLDPGILLAYLGHQVESRQLVRYGLAIAEQAAPQDTLVPVLRRIWLGDPQDQPDAASAPASGDSDQPSK